MVAGNIAEIGLSLQAARGAPATVVQHRMRITGGGFAEVLESEDVVESTGARMLEDSFIARLRVEGAPQINLRPNFAGLLCYGALGAKAVTGAADPYLWTLTAAADLPYLTVWAQLANGKFVQGQDCKIVHLRLESSAGGLLVATATIMGRIPHYRDAAGYATDMAAVAVETADFFRHSDAQGLLLVEGVAASGIDRAALDIDNSGAMQYGDSITPDDVTVARQNVTVETNQLVTDFALWNRVHYGSATPANDAPPINTVLELGGAPSGIDFKYVRGGVAPVAPARSLEYLVPRLQVASIGGLEYNAAGDPLKAAVTYRARKPAAGSPVTIKIQNSQATYPAL